MATLEQLVGVRSRAAESISRYLDAVERALSRNRLLEKFGRRMDSIRMPLQCEPFREDDLDRVCAREHFRDPGADDDEEKAERRDYSAQSRLRPQSWEHGEEQHPPSEPLDEALANAEMAAVLGDAGSGKTECLKSLVRGAAKELAKRLEDGEMLPEDALPPLFVSLSAVGRALEYSEEALRSLAVTQTGKASARPLGPHEKAAAILVAAAHQTLAIDLTLESGFCLHKELEFPSGWVWGHLWRTLIGSTRVESTSLSPKAQLQHAPPPAGPHPPRLFSVIDYLCDYLCESLDRQKNAAWLRAHGLPSGSLPTVGWQKLLLCLDGWDEVPTAARDGVKKTVMVLAEQSPVKVIVSSRQAGWDSGLLLLPAGVKAQRNVRKRELHLLDFGPQEVERFFHSFYPGRPGFAKDLVADLHSKPKVAAMLSNPLMATLAGLAFAPKDEGGAGMKPPARRSELYEAVLHKLLGQEDAERKGRAKTDTQEEKLEVLEALAFRFFPEKVLPKKEAEEFIDRYLRNRTRATLWNRLKEEVQVRRRHHILDVLSRDDAVLTAAGGEKKQAYLFLHPTIHEYLAARHLAQAVNLSKPVARRWESAKVTFGKTETPVRVSELLDRKAEDPEWREVIVLLAGSLQDAEAMLRLIESGTPMDWRGSDRRHDIFHGRLCLGAACLAEVGAWARRHGRESAAERIASEVWRLWLMDKGRWLSDRRVLDSIAMSGVNVGEGPLLDVLARRLRDPIASVQRSAVNAVAEVGTTAATEPILEALALLLESRETSLLQAVVDALGRLGAAAAKPELLRRLADMLRDRGLRRAAAVAVGRLGASAAKPNILERLTELLCVRNCDVRQVATHALGRLGAAAATEPILAQLPLLLEDRVASVRQAAAETVGRLGAAAATEPILAQLPLLLEDRVASLRQAAADTVRVLGRTVVKNDLILVRLACMLDDPVDSVRHAAACAVCGLEAEVANALLQGSGLREARFRSSLWMTGVLGQECSLWIRAKSVLRRAGSARKTMKQGLAKAVDQFSAALETLLDHRDVGGLSGGKVAWAFLVDLWDSLELIHADREAVLSALNVVERLGVAVTTEPVLTVLRRLLAEHNPSVRQAAIKVVGRLAAAATTPEILGSLAESLGHRNRGVRDAAAEASYAVVSLNPSEHYFETVCAVFAKQRTRGELSAEIVSVMRRFQSLVRFFPDSADNAPPIWRRVEHLARLPDPHDK